MPGKAAKIVRTSELALILGISTRTVLRLVGDGLPLCSWAMHPSNGKRPRAYLFDLFKVTEWLRTNPSFLLYLPDSKAAMNRLNINPNDLGGNRT